MIKNVQQGNPLTSNIDPSEVGKAAISGTVVGGVAGAAMGAATALAGTGFGGVVLGGAPSGVTSSQAAIAMSNKVAGRPNGEGMWDITQMLAHETLGGIGGALTYGLLSGYNNLRFGSNQGETTSSGSTCGDCGTVKPNLVRSWGALRIDDDGASVYYETCVARGNTPYDADGKYWINSFNEFENMASKYGVGGPEYSGNPADPGHFSVFVGGEGSGAVYEILNSWIREVGPSIPIQ